MRHAIRTTLLLTLVTATPAGAQIDAVPSDTWRVTGSVEGGFDSFQERYSIVDADTLDSVNEFRSRLRLGLAHGSRFKNYFLAEGRGVVGDGNYDAAGRVRFVRILGGSRRSRLSLEADYLARRFDQSSAFQFSNDVNRVYAKAYLRQAVSRSTAVRVTYRLEGIDFDERTEFDYDYTRQHVTLNTETDITLSSYFNLGLRFTTMAVPDTTEIEYHSWMPLAEYRYTSDYRQSAYVQGGVERRNYGDETTRSSFWAVLASGGIELPVGRVYSVDVITEIEHYDYDTDTGVYFNYFENRTAVLFNYAASWSSKVGIGPTAAVFLSESSPGDEYREIGVRIRGEYSRGARLWVSASYEPGRRVYPAFNPGVVFDFESVFSDYTYHRVSLLGTYRLAAGLNFNAFVDFQPEDHERESDDATSTLISVSLSYAF